MQAQCYQHEAQQYIYFHHTQAPIPPDSSDVPAVSDDDSSVDSLSCIEMSGSEGGIQR